MAERTDPVHLVLIDGSGFIFRAFHALPPMTDAEGTPVNAVFGFANMLSRLLRAHKGTHLAVIFDAGRETFRNRLFPAYKAQRPPPPDELVPQFALVREAAQAFGAPAIELADWEADDLIASYARAAVAAGGTANIISSDKDLMQLIRPGVTMQDPIRETEIGLEAVMQKFGVGPDRLIDAQALIGDPVDNVPGVPGIGPKTAAQLILEFGDLEAILAAAPAMKPGKRRDMLMQHAEQARMSRRLVTLRDDAPLPLPLDALAVRAPDPATLAGFLGRYGFRSLISRLNLVAPQPDLSDPPAETASPPVPFGPYAIITEAAGLGAFLDESQRSCQLALVPIVTDDAAGSFLPIGLGLAVAPGRAAYVPLRHAGDLDRGAPAQLDPVRVAECLGPWLTDPAILKLAHDFKHARHCLAGAAIHPQDDVMLMAYAIETGLHGFDLDGLTERHLGHALTRLDTVSGIGRNRVALATLPADRVAQVAAARADAVLRLRARLHPMLRQQRGLCLYEQVDRRLSDALFAMEQAGIRIDAGELQAISTEFAARMQIMAADIHRLAGTDFNVASPKQLGDILFETLNLPGGRRMKTGAYGTDAQVLQTLADDGHEIAARVLEWRQLAKLKSTYADALVKEANPRTGRIHTRFAMAATATGRLSSVDPNLQNIPIRNQEGGRIRAAFCAAEGHVLVSADYSQIELRLLAHVADLPGLRESFRNHEDIHARTASEVFGVPLRDIDPATRRRAKAINFGIIYGISAFGLARQLSISPAEAKTYIDAYFQRYPGIRDYMEATKRQAREQGFVLTPFGRRCHISGIADKNPARRAYAERQAINAPLQGGAADIVKRAMVHLPAALADQHRDARLLLQVHDELLFETLADTAQALARVVTTTMESAAELSVPLVVETGIGRTWADAH